MDRREAASFHPKSGCPCIRRVICDGLTLCRPFPVSIQHRTWVRSPPGRPGRHLLCCLSAYSLKASSTNKSGSAGSGTNFAPSRWELPPRLDDDFRMPLRIGEIGERLRDTVDADACGDH